MTIAELNRLSRIFDAWYFAGNICYAIAIGGLALVLLKILTWDGNDAQLFAAWGFWVIGVGGMCGVHKKLMRMNRELSDAL